MARRIRNEPAEKNRQAASGIAGFLRRAACTCKTLEFCTKLEISSKKSTPRLKYESREKLLDGESLPQIGRSFSWKSLKFNREINSSCSKFRKYFSTFSYEVDEILNHEYNNLHFIYNVDKP